MGAHRRRASAARSSGSEAFEQKIPDTGGDLINHGASNSNNNPGIVTLDLGTRLNLGESLTLGAAYEFPSADEENGLMEARITVDALVKV